jgi:SAM-dependent methyltransferase
MERKSTLEEVQAYWTRQAQIHGQLPAASWSDQMVIEMEIRNLLPYLSDGDYVLDVGCANGYSTNRLASQKQIDILGLDYVPEMIQAARVLAEQTAPESLSKIAFDVGNITDLQYETCSYDKVISIRVIINLVEWTVQLRGLMECVRVLKPGGLLLLSEATIQGWNKMNEFRREWGLPEIPMPTFNQYLDEELVINALSEQCELVTISNFSSTYFVATRVLKPLLARLLDLKIDVSDPLLHWNRWASELPAWGDYGTQKLFVFRKK